MSYGSYWRVRSAGTLSCCQALQLAKISGTDEIYWSPIFKPVAVLDCWLIEAEWRIYPSLNLAIIGAGQAGMLEYRQLDTGEQISMKY